MTNRHGASVALVLAFVSGCAQTGGGSTTAPPEYQPLLGSLCDLFARCPDDLPPIGSRSRAECMDIVYWAVTCRIDDTGVQRVPLPVDAATAETCAAALDGIACDELASLSDGTRPEVAACAPLFEGLAGDDDDGGDDEGETAAPGERCNRYGTPRCDPAHYCAGQAFDEENAVMLCEVCMPLLGIGGACDWYAPSPECGAGLVCVRDVATGTASCQTIRAAGEPCSGGSECASGFCDGTVCRDGGRVGDPCVENDECRADDGITCVLGACERRRDHGEPCEEDSDCRALRCHTDGLCGLPDGTSCPGLGCRTGYCTGVVCQPRLENGAACRDDDWCESRHCDDATRLCATAPPPQPLGGSCSDASQCEEGLACDGTCYRSCADGCPDGLVCVDTGRSECVPPMPEGSSCRGDAECTTGFCNDSDVCAVRPGIGDPCSGLTDCFPRGYCADGVCAERAGPDQPCDRYDGCQQPFYCDAGRCTLISLLCEPAPIGEQCTLFGSCAADAYCDYSSLTCVARHQLGEPCSQLVTRDGDDCAPGLYCADDGTGAASCRPRIATGSACVPGDVCDEGSFCIGGTCVAVPGGGSHCSGDDECPLGTYCDDDSDVCEPLRQSGDPCEPWSSDRGRCDPALFCDEDTSTCTARRDVGGECDDTSDCADELLCDRDTRTCAERPAVGEPCDYDRPCAEGATCSATSSGTCLARAGLGEPCTGSGTSSDCLEDLYCAYESATDETRCAARRELGASCGSWEECLSRICVSGRCLAREECVMPGTP